MNINDEQGKKYLEIVKSGNMDLMFDFGKETERIRIVKIIKEKGLHLGYANNILELINQNNE